MFVRNSWYVAAWDDEIGRKPVARTFLNENVVLFRTEGGLPVALEDRCAHRRLPLSEGNLIGDTLQCRYHGLVYDCSGRCVHIPGQPKIPAGTGVRCYPCVERHRFVYVWMGAPELADSSRIIDFPRLDDPAWALTKVHLLIRANYLLIVDNLLDLSHVAYVHATTIGNAPVAEDADVKTSRNGDRIRVTRVMSNVEAARTYAEFGPHNGRFDRWQLSEFIPPAYFFINNGSEAAGRNRTAPERVETQGDWGFQVYHGITPATDRTTHQFWAVAHEACAVAPDNREEFYRQCHQVIHEDVAVYEAQQIAIDSDPVGASAENVNSSVSIRYDSGLTKARRTLRRMLKEEGAARPGRRSRAAHAASQPL